MANNCTVLFLDGDRQLNFINRCAFEIFNYTVHTATTLGEAYRLIAECPPDVIIMEVELPDGDGFMFCEEIRNMIPAEILFLTARTEKESLLRGLSLGSDYITKPHCQPELMARVEATMRWTTRRMPYRDGNAVSLTAGNNSTGKFISK